jgi:hypothetical protein
VIDIPDAELWDTHQKLKLRLVEFVRERMRRRAERIANRPKRSATSTTSSIPKC